MLVSRTLPKLKFRNKIWINNGFEISWQIFQEGQIMLVALDNGLMRKHLSKCWKGELRLKALFQIAFTIEISGHI